MALLALCCSTGDCSGLGVEVLGFGWGTLPQRLGALRREGADEVGEDGLIGAGGGQHDPDARRRFDDAGSELDEAQAHGVELGEAPGRAPRCGGTQGIEQPEGGGMQDETELIGGGAVAGGAIGPSTSSG